MPKRKSYRPYSKKKRVVTPASVSRMITKRLKKMEHDKMYGAPGTAASLDRYGPSYNEVYDLAMLYGPDTETGNAARGMISNRIADKYYGRGDYWSTLKKYGKGALRLGSAVGTAASSAYKGQNLNQIGRAWQRGLKKGSQVSKMYGLGDYSSANQIVADPPKNPNQSVHHITSVDTDLSGDIIYSNTEFIKNIYATITSGTSDFKVESFSINPALSETFPFLSQIAQNFELYEFMGLCFQYKPTSGEFGSNNSNALGKVVLATNYDPDAPAFTNSIVMENYDWACSTKPSGGCVHGVECLPSQRSTMQMYTRTGVGNKDKVFTDLGNFQIASEGIPSSVAQDVLIGELWVTYSVKLSRARLYQSIGDSIPHALFRGSLGTNLGAKTWIPDSDNTIGQVFSPLLPSGLNVSIVGISPTVINILFGNNFQGKRILLYSLSGSSPAAGQSKIFAAITDCTLVEGSSIEESGSQSSGIAVIDFSNNQFSTATVRLTYGVAPSATQSDRLAITLVDPQFTYFDFSE